VPTVSAHCRSLLAVSSVCKCHAVCCVLVIGSVTSRIHILGERSRHDVTGVSSVIHCRDGKLFYCISPYLGYCFLISCLRDRCMGPTVYSSSSEQTACVLGQLFTRDTGSNALIVHIQRFCVVIFHVYPVIRCLKVLELSLGDICNQRCL